MPRRGAAPRRRSSGTPSALRDRTIIGLHTRASAGLRPPPTFGVTVRDLGLLQVQDVTPDPDASFIDGPNQPMQIRGCTFWPSRSFLEAHTPDGPKCIVTKYCCQGGFWIVWAQGHPHPERGTGHSSDGDVLWAEAHAGG